MKLIRLEIGEKFRSLHAGFSMDFHSLDSDSLDKMATFQPFCFAGLNGSGKSNVLEALSAIFYHLELCVAKYRPESLNRHFNRSKCSPDAFTIKYLTCGHDKKYYVPALSDLVTISKEVGKEPIMTIQAFPFSEEQEEKQVSLLPLKGGDSPAHGKEYLPNVVVGYSSGENEILSLPFIKSRLVHYDEYMEAIDKGYHYYEPETSLVYIDNRMSQAVLLSILLLEDEKTLEPLKNELNIIGLRSFRINVNLHRHYLDTTKDISHPITSQLNEQIEKLQRCSTSWFQDKDQMYLDFYVDKETKKAFCDNFKSSFELFRLFQILYELNLRIVRDDIKEEVYSSKGYYTDGKLPVASPKDNVFYFLDYLILKQVDGESKPLELLLRNFSDGEHQFLHTMGICLMLKDRSSIMLLDEPETHFNPGWRAKFIKVLSDTIKAGGGNNMMKDVLLSSHSPFIISDCMPNNVIIFEKENGITSAIRASELGIDTYGTSVNILTSKIFKNKETIGTFAISELNKFKEKVDMSKRREDIIDEVNNTFGDSIEKLMLINEITNIKNDA